MHTHTHKKTKCGRQRLGSSESTATCTTKGKPTALVPLSRLCRHGRCRFYMQTDVLDAATTAILVGDWATCVPAIAVHYLFPLRHLPISDYPPRAVHRPPSTATNETNYTPGNLSAYQHAILQQQEDERMNERTKERTKERTNERTNERMGER